MPRGPGAVACCVAGSVLSLGAVPRSLSLAWPTASSTWDHKSWYALACRDIQLRRETGALTFLPIALNNLAMLLVRQGDLDPAAVLLAEAAEINEVTGSQYAPYGATH